MVARVDWKTICVGDSIPKLEKKVNQRQIDKWAKEVDDFNPLHVDPEYAKKTKFGKTIAHGPLIIAYISEMMGNWIGDGWLEGGKLLDIKFKAPVKSGDQIIVEGKIVDKKIINGLKWIECDIFIINQDNNIVTQGKALGPIE